MIDFDRDTALLQQVLDLQVTRTKAALHNIANQNVPGYKRYEVRFEQALQQALALGKDPGRVEPEVVRDESGEPGQNNVVLMDELTLLDKTRLTHDVFTRRLGGYFAKLNKAVFGR